MKFKEKTTLGVVELVGAERLELPNDGIRIRSLTTWRRPSKTLILYHKQKKSQFCLKTF